MYVCVCVCELWDGMGNETINSGRWRIVSAGKEGATLSSPTDRRRSWRVCGVYNNNNNNNIILSFLASLRGCEPTRVCTYRVSGITNHWKPLKCIQTIQQVPQSDLNPCEFVCCLTCGLLSREKSSCHALVRFRTINSTYLVPE